MGPKKAMLTDNMRERYNEIASNYSVTNERPYVKHYLDYSLFKEIDAEFQGRLSKLSTPKILDLGCGDGRQSRRLKEKYPNINITAVDISEEQINIAKHMTPTLDIQFISMNAQDLDYIEEFDLIFASYLLCNSESRVDMMKFCSSIYKALKPGSKFITFDPNVALNPDDVYRGLESHGLRCVWIPSEDNHTDVARDGERYLCEVWDPENKENSMASFYSHYLTKVTYEECFQKAGFVSSLIDPQIDPLELIKTPDIWKPMINRDPSGVIIILLK